MNLPWRSMTPWAIAIVATITGAALVLFDTPSYASASFGWFAYQPLARETFALLGGVPLSLQGIIGLAVAGLGVIGLSWLLSRVARRRAHANEQPSRRYARFAWWGPTVLTLAGGVIAYISLSAPQPSFMYGDSYIGFADGQPRIPARDLIRDGFVVSPTAFIGVALIVVGLAVAAFLLGRFGVAPRANRAHGAEIPVYPNTPHTDE
jgi:hypothetical protein